MEKNHFYVINGELLFDEPVTVLIPSEVEWGRIVASADNVLTNKENIGFDNNECVFPIDDYIWFASEKAFKEFEKDIESLDDVDFAEQDDFKNNVTYVSIWVESQDEPILKQYPSL